MSDLVERLRGYRAAAYPAHGSGFVGLFTGEGSALMLDAATTIETLMREKSALMEQLLHPDPDDEKDNLRLHREKCDALDRAYAAEARAEAAEKLVATLREDYIVAIPQVPVPDGKSDEWQTGFGHGVNAMIDALGCAYCDKYPPAKDHPPREAIDAARAWTDKHDKSQPD